VICDLLQKLHVTGTKDKKEVNNVYIMSSSCEILEQSAVKAMKTQYKECNNDKSNVLMSILSSFVFQHASKILYIHSEFHLNNDWWFSHMKYFDYTHEILSLIDSFQYHIIYVMEIKMNIYFLFYRLYEIVWLWRHFQCCDLLCSVSTAGCRWVQFLSNGLFHPVLP